MTPQSSHPGGLHTGRPAADHKDFFRNGRGLKGEVISPAEGGVDAAPDRQRVLLPGEALQTGRAGGDVFQPSLGDLAGIVGIGKKPPGETDEVRHAVLQDPFAEFGIQPSHGKDGDGHHRLDGGRQRDQSPRFFYIFSEGRLVFQIEHLLRVAQPVVRAETPCAYAQIAGARLLEYPGDLLAFRHGQPVFDPVLGAIHPYADDKIRTDEIPDGADDLDGKTSPALHILTTVCVPPPVPGQRKKGVDQIVVGSVDFHAVKSGLLCPLGTPRKFFDESLDFGRGYFSKLRVLRLGIVGPHQ